MAREEELCFLVGLDSMIRVIVNEMIVTGTVISDGKRDRSLVCVRVRRRVCLCSCAKNV
jgi:hypothetical protein